MEEYIRDILNDNTDATTAYGVDAWFLSIGKMIEEPVRAVVIRAAGGISPNAAIRLNMPTIQVVVRGPSGEYTATKTMATTIRNVLHARDMSGYADPSISGIIQQGDILFLGEDDSGRPQFSMNFRVFETSTATDNRDDV